MKYVLKEYPKKLILFVVLTISLSTLMVMNAVVLQAITNAATNSGKKVYGLIVIGVIIFIVLQTIVYYSQQYYSEYLARESISLYRKIIFKKISRQNLDDITKSEVGDYIAIMTTQMDDLEENYFTAIYWGFYLLMQFILACITAMIINPIMALFAIILSTPNIFLPFLVKRKLEKVKVNMVDKRNSYVANVTDYFSGIVDWKVNNSESLISNQEKLNNNILLQSQKAELKVQNKVTAINKLFSDVLYFGTWLLGVFFVIKQNLTLGAVVAFAQLITNISFPIYSFSDIFAQLVGGNKLYKQIERRFDENGNNKVIDNAPINKFKQIKLQDVTVQIGDKQVFTDLNLTIDANKKYLIHGPSGSGKSTFIKLLIKQITEYQGNIKINDLDIKRIPDHDIYNLIGYLPQDGHVFSTTLRNNLTLYRDRISDKQILEVLNFVDLDKWANLKSLNMKIGKTEVSGGEAKRIELARILLQNKPILILDEFSSGIDKKTLKSVESKIFKLPKTVIYISHVYDKNLIDKVDGTVDFATNELE